MSIKLKLTDFLVEDAYSDSSKTFDLSQSDLLPNQILQNKSKNRFTS